MHKYKGIIFDLDGTLINSLEDLIDSCNVIMKYYEFPTYSYEVGKKLIGRGLRNLIMNAIPEKYQDDDVFIDALTEMLQSEYMTRYTRKTKPYPGMLNLLNYLRAHHIPFGVCTNKPDSVAKSLVSILFKDYDFVDVIGYTNDELRKPNPQATLGLVDRMDIKPEECLYVGDSTIDYQTAVNAGMLPVLCTWGFAPVEVITKLERSIWVDNPMRIIDALLYGREMYSVFNEKPNLERNKK